MSANKYKKEYCELLIKHMRKGFSYETFGATVGCGRTTLYDWERLHKDWKQAKAKAIEEAQKFFESRLLAKLSGQKLTEGFDIKMVDTACLIFALKTRFHKTYGENKDIDISVTPPKIVINMGNDE